MILHSEFVILLQNNSKSAALEFKPREVSSVHGKILRAKCLTATIT